MAKNNTTSKRENALNKVAKITFFFWLIKIFSTTVGEASADFFGNTVGVVSVVPVFTLLVASIFMQIKFKRYVPWMYWTVIVLIAIFGTMFSDGLHGAGIPLTITSLVFFALLLLTFYIWHKNEKTLDPHVIHTTRREIFYWTVIFFTFALGTAAGDLVAERFHFGYLDATLIFGVAMLLIPLCLYLVKCNKVALFWITYILTRPFGAAGADLIAKPVKYGGFGLGDGTTSLLFLTIIIVLVIYLTIYHRKQLLIEERLQ